MDRLTERSNIGWWLSELKNESGEYDDCSICCEKQQGCDCCRNCPIQKAVDKLAHYEDLEEQGRLIDRELIEKALMSTMMALSVITEICVDESKMHISSEEAIGEIREKLREYDPVGSRLRLKELLDDLAEAKLKELEE